MITSLCCKRSFSMDHNMKFSEALYEKLEHCEVYSRVENLDPLESFDIFLNTSKSVLNFGFKQYSAA